MRDAVIVPTARTGTGRALRGRLNATRSQRVMGHAVARAGVDPAEGKDVMIGPVFAVPRLLEHAGLTVRDIALRQLNAAFAVQALQCRDRPGVDPAICTMNGAASRSAIPAA